MQIFFIRICPTSWIAKVIAAWRIALLRPVLTSGETHYRGQRFAECHTFNEKLLRNLAPWRRQLFASRPNDSANFPGLQPGAQAHFGSAFALLLACRLWPTKLFLDPDMFPSHRRRPVR